MVRCFIGISIPEEVKKDIKNIQDEIGKLPISCKFVETENLHLCLLFIGEVQDDKIEYISAALDDVCSRFSSFDVSIRNIKTIPNENYIRVIAIDAIDENKNLERISSELKQKISGDYKPPHLTLCRVKKIDDRQKVLTELKNMQYDKKIRVSEIQLIKSELTRSGPVYKVIHECGLPIHE